MKEIWKETIHGYEISNFGRLLSPNGIFVILQRDKQGYLTYQIKRKNYKIHRLVAEAFHPNLHNKKCVNHMDGIKSNNYSFNLEWVTHSENLLHALKLGLTKPQQLGKSGILHSRSKPLISINQTAIIEHESRNLCAKYLRVHVKAVNVALNSGGYCRGHKLYSL